MSSIQITSLPVAVAFSGTEQFELVQAGVSVRGTIAQFIGSATGLTTPFAIAIGGTGATTATGARTNLGLGTIAIQNASAVAITGGTVDGTAIGSTAPSSGAFTTVTATTPIAIASGGTGATTATGARANLGVGSFANQIAYVMLRM